jgi:hypothetical protein
MRRKEPREGGRKERERSQRRLHTEEFEGNNKGVVARPSERLEGVKAKRYLDRYTRKRTPGRFQPLTLTVLKG